MIIRMRLPFFLRTPWYTIEMFWLAKKYLICTVLILCIVHCIKSECIQSTPCQCIREDGTGYNLTSLQQKGPFHNEKQNFSFQPCNDVNLTFNVINATNSSQCTSTSICMLNNKNESINLGASHEAEWHLPTTENDASLTFHHGNYQTIISLICCKSCESSLLIFMGVNGTKYDLILMSPQCCLVSIATGGLSTGSVLVILLCVFSTLYLIGGALALKIFRGAVGLELIPNYDFWSQLPGLVRDGITFTLSGCSAVSYDRI